MNQSEQKCYKCNRPGHFARECRSGGDGGGGGGRGGFGGRDGGRDRDGRDGGGRGRSGGMGRGRMAGRHQACVFVALPLPACFLVLHVMTFICHYFSLLYRHSS